MASQLGFFLRKTPGQSENPEILRNLITLGNGWPEKQNLCEEVIHAARREHQHSHVRHNDFANYFRTKIGETLAPTLLLHPTRSEILLSTPVAHPSTRRSCSAAPLLPPRFPHQIRCGLDLSGRILVHNGKPRPGKGREKKREE